MPAGDPHGLRFGEVAAAYDRGRPPYPEVAVDWLLSSRPRRVLDLGAGTGKLTESLVQRCDEVIAVEPSAGMREVLSRKLPTVRAMQGTAERIPLPDGSVDAVLVAQAWHWVDPVIACPEVARVLAPEGVLGLVWNDRDESDTWIAELTRLLQEYGTTPDLGYQPTVAAPFGPFSTYSCRWTHRVTEEEIVDMVTSRSYVIALPDDQRATLVARLRQLITNAHPGRDGRLPVPYVTNAFIARVIAP